MAALTWYMTNALLAGSGHQELTETPPGTDATSSPTAGWVVAKTAAARFSAFMAQTERPANTFGTTELPAAGSLGSDDALATPAHSGDYASGDWTFTFEITAVTNANGQDGNFGLRLYKSANADGSSATEITSGRQETDIVTNLATGATTELSVTFNPGAISLSNEHLFVQLAWEITGAAGNNNSDVVLRVGDTATRIVTADFTAAAEPQFMDAGPAVATASAVSATLQPVANDVNATPPSATVSAVTPTLEQAAGSQELDATPAVASVSAIASTLELGAVELSAGPAAASALVPASTFALGAVEHSLAAAVALASCVAATLEAGALEFSAGPALATASAVAATFGLPSTDVDTTPAIATASAVAPTLETGAVTIDAGPALASTAVVACTLEPAPYELNVGVALASASAVTPTLEVPSGAPEPHIPDIDALVQALTEGI